MIGLAYLFVGAIYLIAMVYLVGWAWRLGRKVSRGAALACATVAFLTLYLPVFWDFIPTHVMYHYYCAKDAGSVVKIDPKQWIHDHSIEIAELRIDPLNPPREFDRFTTQNGWEGWYPNRAVIRRHRVVQMSSMISVQRLETEVADVRTGNVLASHVDYQAGTSLASGSYKVWNYRPTCDGWKSRHAFSSAATQYELEGN